MRMYIFSYIVIVFVLNYTGDRDRVDITKKIHMYVQRISNKYNIM